MPDNSFMHSRFVAATQHTLDKEAEYIDRLDALQPDLDGNYHIPPDMVDWVVAIMRVGLDS